MVVILGVEDYEDMIDMVDTMAELLRILHRKDIYRK